MYGTACLLSEPLEHPHLLICILKHQKVRKERLKIGVYFERYCCHRTCTILTCPKWYYFRTWKFSSMPNIHNFFISIFKFFLRRRQWDCIWRGRFSELWPWNVKTQGRTTSKKEERWVRNHSLSFSTRLLLFYDEIFIFCYQSLQWHLFGNNSQPILCGHFKFFGKWDVKNGTLHWGMWIMNKYCYWMHGRRRQVAAVYSGSVKQVRILNCIFTEFIFQMVMFLPCRGPWDFLWYEWHSWYG